jgi:hypothetical protein
MKQYILKSHGNRKFSSLEAIQNFLDREDPDLLNELNKREISLSQYLFNLKTKRDPFNKNAKSILSDKPTTWNEKSGMYNRIHESEKKEYRELFRQRMLRIHKSDNLLNDPEMQKKMLSSRKISGEYKARNGEIFSYVGSYELDFLQVLDLVLNWDMNDVLLPAPMVFPYKDDEKVDHFYIPDVYFTSLDLIVEIKSGENKHYRQRDLALEFSKDKEVLKSSHSYLKILDKDYNEFLNFVKSFRLNNLTQQ